MTQERKQSIIKKGKFPGIMGALIGAIVLMMAAIAFLFPNTISAGAKSIADSYARTYEEQRNETYRQKYNDYKESAEEKFHVSNRVSIYIENLQEEEKLEVLKVTDVELITEDTNKKTGNVISWLEVPGEGTFVVDLKAGEYIVDNERAHVLVRVPYPELVNVTIDYSNVQKLFFKDDVGIFNGSYREGEDIARRQLSEAELLIKKEFTSNQNFYQNAQESAVMMIQTLVRQLNPKVEDLTVDVEFY